MEIIVFILLVGVWAAFLLPSFMNSRKESTVDRRTAAPAQTMRPRDATLAAVRPARVGQVAARDRVLARRRLALIGLASAVAITLIGAIATGSRALFILNIVVDLALAGYVALLLNIKQQRSTVAATPSAPVVANQAAPAEDQRVRIVSG